MYANCLQYFLITVINGCLAGNGQSLSTPFYKIAEEVQDRCQAFGECVKQNGIKVVNKTVTISKETLHNGGVVLNDTITYTKESLKKLPIQSISDIITNAKCVIPKNADNILRATLLQQCISPSLGFGNESRCFDELGCFPMIYPWTSNLRPFPQPMTPEEIDVKLYSYTRKQNTRYNVKLWPDMSIEGSDFNSNRNFTAFISFMGSIATEKINGCLILKMHI